MNSDSPIPSDTRRDFVKKSLAASIIAAQPTLLSGLIRAQGGGGTGSGGWETTEPGTGTTIPEPTEWDTTEPETTALEKGMLCSSPFTQNQILSDAIELDGGEYINLVVTSTTRARDLPGVNPYKWDTPVWVIQVAIYLTSSTSLLFSESQVRSFEFEEDDGTISSAEPTPPSDASGAWGISYPVATSFTTPGGNLVQVLMESEIANGGSRDISLYQRVQLSTMLGGVAVPTIKNNVKNLTYVAVGY